jgi:hypothetical protein
VGLDWGGSAKGLMAEGYGRRRRPGFFNKPWRGVTLASIERAVAAERARRGL